MQKPTRTMWVMIAIVCAIAAGTHLWAWLEPACSNEQRRVIMKMSGGVGCTEFWLNRYQTAWVGVLTTGGALFAAWLAWTAVQKQIEVANLQNVAIQLQIIEGMLASFVKDIHLTSKVCGTVVSTYKHFITNDDIQWTKGKFKALQENDPEITTEIAALYATYPPWSTETSDIRKAMVDTIHGLNINCTGQMLVKFLKFNNKPEYSAEDENRLIAEGTVLYAEWEKLATQYGERAPTEHATLNQVAERLRRRMVT